MFVAEEITTDKTHVCIYYWVFTCAVPPEMLNIKEVQIDNRLRKRERKIVAPDFVEQNVETRRQICSYSLVLKVSVAARFKA